MPSSLKHANKLNVLEDAEMEGFVMKDMSVNVQMDFMVLTVKKASAICHVEMELSVNHLVDYMGPVLDLTHASVKKVGMEDTATKVSGNGYIGYGANLVNALRPSGTKHRQQHTPSPKRAEEKQESAESNYIW
ncbi:hypothetical protein JD844_027932 [Phrynosoma platyrhinos]|uniref:Uncharacterized protein n=1 Tax=Phrynosoma platyrhinos TaxID=52577 RepID=A0ABQ7SH49_PHRPL|nr:hypothetical protein JD844_027932 [Phrynosoma platyrhinos]